MDENDIPDAELAHMWEQGTPVELVSGFLWDEGSSTEALGTVNFHDSSPRANTSASNELTPA